MIKRESLIDFKTAVSAGEVDGWSIVRKWGRNSAVGTTLVPITLGGIYRTPQVSGATKLRVKAGNAADTVAGAGARKIYIQGIDASGNEVTEELVTAGASASVNSTNDYIRLYRAYVTESGTYADQTAGSHVADIVIENSAGTEDWLIVDSTVFPKSQSEVSSYTVPNGYEAYIPSISIKIETLKVVDLDFLQRRGILKTEAPYDAMRIISHYKGLDGTTDHKPEFPIDPFPAGTDIGFMGVVSSGTAEVEVEFEILLKKV